MHFSPCQSGNAKLSSICDSTQHRFSFTILPAKVSVSGLHVSKGLDLRPQALPGYRASDSEARCLAINGLEIAKIKVAMKKLKSIFFHSMIFGQKNVKFCLSLVIVTASTIALAVTIHAQQIAQVKPQTSVTRQSPSNDQLAEARTLLNALGYWVDMNVTGTDASLRHALVAFQKVEDRNRTGVLTPEELLALRMAKPPSARETGYPHIEVDLSRQVLFAVECGESPLKILPISSGSGELFTEGGVTRRAVTPTGRFKVKWKINGWRKSPLGLLYYPSYIYDGIAIHGNPLVPATPASHGCIRIPMFAAKQFSEMAVIGMDVIVYDDNLLPP